MFAEKIRPSVFIDESDSFSFQRFSHPNSKGSSDGSSISVACRFACQIVLVQRLAQVGFYNSLAADI
jgi:hypothetical protein